MVFYFFICVLHNFMSVLLILLILLVLLVLFTKGITFKTTLTTFYT